MGVYIKGMDMSEIEKLVFTDKVQLVFVWTSTPSILTAKTISETKDGAKAYSKEYEVIKVEEPHGRIVDESKINTVYGQKDILTTSYYGLHTDGFLSVTEFITGTDAPTIIEAEG